MSWITTLYATMAALSATLGGVYLAAWLMQREDGSYLLFVALAASVIGVAGIELWMLRAPTPEVYGLALRWLHVPIWSGISVFVILAYLRLRPRFPLIGWLALGLRTAALVPNFVSGANLNYLALTDLDQITLLGEPVVVVTGVPNPWMLMGQASNALLFLFILDGSISVWRRGEGARAIALALGLLASVTLSATHAVLTFWGFTQVPVMFTPLLLFVAAAMGFELSFGLLRAARAERDVEVKEAALSLSEQRLSLAAEAADAGFWSLDGQSGAVWATAKTRELFGLPAAGDLRLGAFLDRVHGEDRTRLEQLIATTLRPNERYRAEFRVADPDGRVRWLAGLGRGVGEPEGPKTLMGVCVDITERRAMLDKIHRQRARLEQVSKLETLAELSASLAHELNQPLAMILTNAEAAQALLAQERPDLTEVREILADIVSADRRAADVIQHLRALVHRGVPQRETLLLEDAIHRVLGLLANEIDDRGVSLALRLASDLPSVQADRILIEQVLLNLLDNACDAVADNPTGERRVSIVTRRQADRVLLEVTDNGGGLSDPQRVFDPFYSTKPGGLGMGMAIVRSIVSSHRGQVSLESATGQGTSVQVSLPRDGGTS
ncbi:hypothetical protein CKO42_00520 [Lamprobacter modestohalophilus]|uniref:histidine kinase n=1 Tax=Lamprobacter modestohalophilus TaxID=1064514 RepID=A0A9X0W4Z7_9GAMM|nr:ATP-binding protein [Lamprobacter modestohalophilus]MBK1616954.1 hypothetical protein [Lamprobacter modestohalophilus]